MTYKYLVKCGHHYWREAETGRIVISDESADGMYCEVGNPKYTDDGVLYLDVARLVTSAVDKRLVKYMPKHGYTLPLLLPDGERSATPASVDEFLLAIALSNNMEDDDAS